MPRTADGHDPPRQKLGIRTDTDGFIPQAHDAAIHKANRSLPGVAKGRTKALLFYERGLPTSVNLDHRFCGGGPARTALLKGPPLHRAPCPSE